MPTDAKRILVTAGNTAVPIDKVRSITNIFGGKTGLVIAKYMASLGHEVTLLTSMRDVDQGELAKVIRFYTFDDLFCAMQDIIEPGEVDIVIHSAAVSDYRVTGTYSPVVSTDWEDGKVLVTLERLDSSSKIGSEYPELYLKMEPTPKIIDQIRSPWGFTGKLVKFKLQVGMTDEDLKEIARKSRITSDADLIVANCMEWMGFRAFIIGKDQEEMVNRSDLPASLARRLEL